MNKILILILVPALVAFVATQVYSQGFGVPGFGAPGFGGVGGARIDPAYAANQYYYNYGQQQAKSSRLFSYLVGGFLLLFLTNFTRTLTG